MHIQKNRALVSWSGGKDCCLAWARARESFEVVGLVTMMTEDGSRSRSHGLRPDVLKAQADAIGLPLITTNAAWGSYEAEFSNLLARASRDLSATHVVFGDVFPEPHRQWVERVCSGRELTAVEPLWAESTDSLVREFLSRGGQAIIATVRDEVLDSRWLGRLLDTRAIEELTSLGVDPCGERGEYHTFVTFFPGFRHSLIPRHLGAAQHGGCSLLELDIPAEPVRV